MEETADETADEMKAQSIRLTNLEETMNEMNALAGQKLNRFTEN